MNNDLNFRLEDIRRFYVQEIPDFGIFYLSVNSAAKLTARDMYYEGIIDTGSSQNEDEDINHPKVIKLLEKHSAILRLGLIKAIDSGRIKAVEKRDINGILDANKTLFHWHELRNWLYEIDYDGGVEISEFRRHRQDIYFQIQDKVDDLTKDLLKKNQEELRQMDVEFLARHAANESIKLKDQLSQQPTNTDIDNKPLHPKERGSLLRVIAALLATPRDKAFDIYSPSAVSILEQMTINAGYSISDDTARKIINQLKNRGCKSFRVNRNYKTSANRSP